MAGCLSIGRLRDWILNSRNQVLQTVQKVTQVVQALDEQRKAVQQQLARLKKRNRTILETVMANGASPTNAGAGSQSQSPQDAGAPAES